MAIKQDVLYLEDCKGADLSRTLRDLVAKGQCRVVQVVCTKVRQLDADYVVVYEQDTEVIPCIDPLVNDDCE